ncbi:MAG TPA: type IV pilus twitching motility protein PilT [Bacillota bacterium]|nr:type IV pilus twitching motility protein PilT [Bacillota bacterium]
MKEVLDKLLRTALEVHASDLHITIGAPPIMRVHGDLKAYGKEPLTPSQTEAMAKSIMNERVWRSFQEKGEVDFSYGIEGNARFRVNAFMQRLSISLAFRLIPTVIPTLDDLQMPETLRKIMQTPQGLILITGPTGSGKSTTLASMLSYLNDSARKHIITLEDPIEYLHKHRKCIIDQREIGQDTQSFANGLRAALRQDPDVILVGEMRDLETISTAITAAETGHLVLGTLHTTDAPSTVDRIIDVFPPEQQPQIRTQLANVLVMILSQRLFPTVDRMGRRAATEILINNTAVANLIRSGKNYQIPSIMQTGRALGMQTLEMSLLELIQRGVISKETARPYMQGNDN